MWNPPGRGYNTVDPDDSALHLDVSLRRRLDALTPRQMVELDLQIGHVVERVYKQLDEEFTPGDEEAYRMQALPENILIQDADPSGDLAQGIAAGIEAVPLRWRLDAAQVIGSYIRDYGPSPRRYFRELKRLQRAGASIEPC